MGKFKVGDHLKGISESGTTETNADGYSPVSGTVSSFVINGQEYTKEQYKKDCERFLEAFTEEDLFDLSYAIEYVLLVYQWAQQNPVVTNLATTQRNWDGRKSRKNGF